MAEKAAGHGTYVETRLSGILTLGGLPDVVCCPLVPVPYVRLEARAGDRCCDKHVMLKHDWGMEGRALCARTMPSKIEQERDEGAKREGRVATPA